MGYPPARAHVPIVPPPAPPMVRPPQHAAPNPPYAGTLAPLPPPPPASSNRGGGGYAHDQSPEAAELTRALSEAIEQAAEEDHGTGRKSWRSTEGAVFEEGTLQLGGLAPAPSSSARQPYDEGHGYAPHFEPAAPVDVGRGGRRMPQVDDFPAVGQREYRAKMGIPEPPDEPEAPPPRKPTFFERITGARRREQERPADNGHRQNRQTARNAAGQGDRDGGHNERGGGASGEPRTDQQGVELPVFFGQDRKR